MAFFKRQDIGRLYVMRMVLPDDTVVHKIGICNSNRATDRMMEILRSWFSYFRFVPYTELKLDMKCHNPKALESYIHKILRDVTFEPNHKVEGETEMFIEVNEPRLLWFLRSYDKSMYNNPPEITSNQINLLREWLTSGN